MDMTMVRAVLLLQGLLLVARCDVGARDTEPEDELESKDMPQHDGWHHGLSHRTAHFGTSHHHPKSHRQSPDIAGTAYHPSEHGHIDPSLGQPSLGLSEETADTTEETGTSGPQARTGNWCAFVHKRIVTTAVNCGTEKYTIKSQSPCPNGSPDCQIVMYKLSTRPVYREKQRIFTALLWKCCAGHKGKNCEELDEHVPEPEDSSPAGMLHPGGLELQLTGYERLTHKQKQEQNDHQDASSPLYEGPTSRENQTEDNSYGYPHTPDAGYENSGSYDGDHEQIGPPPEATFPDPKLLNIDYLKDIMISHLQPIFDKFNASLERLSENVRELKEDMFQLQLQQELDSRPDSLGGRGVDKLQQREDKLVDSFQQLEDLKKQMSLQREEMEDKFHAQRSMLHYNLTQFKTDVDIKIKRNQKMLQTSVHSLNSSLSELMEEQEQLKEHLQRVWTPASPIPTQGKPQTDPAVWEAITRLDNKVVNNSINLSALNEYQIQLTDRIVHLESGWSTLEEKVAQTDRKSEDRYIETILEVDGAKMGVQDYVNNMTTNITAIQGMLQEIEVDVDYLYTAFYKNISSSSGTCDCKPLSMSVAQLKQAVANITVLANENRLALDREAEDRLDSWEDGGWGPLVEDLKLNLLNVQNSLVLEQEKIRSLQQNVTMLHTSLSSSKLDIETLQNQDKVKDIKILQLNNFFNSLLTDAIRHTEILEILLGEEVLEFIEWPLEDKEGHSIPALKESMRVMQERFDGHSRSLASMLNSEDSGAEVPSLLEDWTPVAFKNIQRGKKFDSLPKTDDFFALKKKVEQLQGQVHRFEEQRCLSCCNCTKAGAARDSEVKLQAELTAVRKSLEDHLSIFSSIFSNTEGLAGSEATLDVEELSSMLKRKVSKEQRKKEKRRGAHSVEHGQILRGKRDASLETAVLSSDSPLMFLASSRDGVNRSGTVIFETVALNRGQMYSPKTGTFRAPTGGVYLFVLTLDFGPGPSLARLKRGDVVVASLHQSQRKPAGPATRVCLLQLEQDEELQLEMVQGTLEHSNPQDNTFAGLLLLQTT